MRSILLVLLSVVFFGESVVAQNIEVPVKKFDFGKILEADGVVHHSFVINSTSTDSILVKKISLGCRCVTSSISDSVLYADSSVVLTLAYDPVDAYGRFSRKVVLSFDSKDSVQFELSGEIIPQAYFHASHFRYAFGPLKMKTKVLQFGQLVQMSSNSKTTYLLNADSVSHELKYRADDTVGIEFKPNEVRSFEVRMDVTPELGLGYRVDTMSFFLDDELWSFPVAYTVVPNRESGGKGVLKMDTTSFDFGRKTKGQVVSHTFLLHNKGEAPLNVIAVESECECVSYKLGSKKIKAGKNTPLKLEFDTSHGTGTQRKKVRIYTDSEKTPVLVVSLKATVSTN